jgi:GTPase SAR1 family protein
MLHLRCVLVGDPCVGKTSLIVAYTRNGFCGMPKHEAIFGNINASFQKAIVQLPLTIIRVNTEKKEK